MTQVVLTPALQVQLRRLVVLAVRLGMKQQRLNRQCQNQQRFRLLPQIQCPHLLLWQRLLCQQLLPCQHQPLQQRLCPWL